MPTWKPPEVRKLFGRSVNPTSKSVNRKKISDDLSLNAAELLARGARDLEAAGVEDPWRQSQDILAKVLNLSRIEILSERDLKILPKSQQAFWKVLRKRQQRIPLQYLLGYEFFLDLKIEIGPGVLIPRPETELLLQEALRLCPRIHGQLIADLGTGSGNIALALAREYPQSKVFGVDRSARALFWAHRNKKRYGFSNLRFFLGDAGGPIPKKYQGRFSMVVSNPPYIPTDMLAQLQPEVRFEPRRALHGGKSGLHMIQHMTTAAARLLGTQGIFICEIGIHQCRETKRIFSRAGFKDIHVLEDWQKIPRIVSGVRI